MFLSIFICVHLDVQTKDGNQLTGSFPSEFGKLSNLDDVSLSTNYFSRTIPTEFGLLSALSSLAVCKSKMFLRQCLHCSIWC